MSPVLLFHICAAIVGLLSGYLSILLRKGSGLHRAAGTIFFVSMLAMSASAAYIAAFMKPNMLNAVTGLLTFYLVSTGWWAGKRGDGKTGSFDLGALLFAMAVGAAAITWGFEAANSPAGSKDGMPAGLYFVFGTITLLCALSDIRMFMRGGLFGKFRRARHLWRMSLALLIATLSFFPGQARQFPDWLRQSSALYLPHLFLLASMIYWIVRVRFRGASFGDGASFLFRRRNSPRPDRRFFAFGWRQSTGTCQSTTETAFPGQSSGGTCLTM